MNVLKIRRQDYGIINMQIWTNGYYCGIGKFVCHPTESKILSAAKLLIKEHKVAEILVKDTETGKVLTEANLGIEILILEE